jgi:D-alanyl-D-alanine carboxypeptidase (penicillin-binding protein 5/6)
MANPSHHAVAGKVLAIVLALAFLLGGFATPLLPTDHAEAASTATARKTADSGTASSKETIKKADKKKTTKKSAKKKKRSKKTDKTVRKTARTQKSAKKSGTTKRTAKAAAVATGAAVAAGATGAALPIAAEDDARFCIIDSSAAPRSPATLESLHSTEEGFGDSPNSPDSPDSSGTPFAQGTTDESDAHAAVDALAALVTGQMTGQMTDQMTDPQTDRMTDQDSGQATGLATGQAHGQEPGQRSNKSGRQSAKHADTQTAAYTPRPALQERMDKDLAPPKLPRDIKPPKRPHLNVKAAYLINMSTGQVYYEQNADKQIPPASITKLLTLYIVREALEKGKLSPRKTIPVSPRAARTSGSRMRLRKGEEVTIDELIKGISVISANDACVAVAEYMGKGDASRFVREMNARAKKMGMTKTVFKNPNGLPAKGQYSTARDIAKLSIHYLKAFPESLSVHSMTSYTHNGSTHRNANSLLGRYEGADGLKTGFVCASGFNISATAKRDGTRLLAVVLGAQTPIIRQVETTKLLDYGFKLVEIQKKTGKRLASIQP